MNFISGRHPPRQRRLPGLRWWIIVLVFLAAVLNYVDRQTLSALAPTIQRDLRMDDRAYANIVNIRTGNSSDAAPWSWRQVFTSRVVWLLLLGRLITDPVWYFYQFWFPKYLNAERGLSQEQLKITWVIYAAAGVGSLLGGWGSGFLVKRGGAPAASRLWVMLGCACIMPVSPLIARLGDTNVALAFAVLAVCAALASLINISSIVVDVVPKSSLGTVFSVVAAGSTVGGIIMNTVVATMVSGPAASPGGFLDQSIRAVLGPILSVVQGQGYGRWFLFMAFLHPLAWLMLYFGGVHRKAATTRPV
jgi:ACS family hexuronate transporter-like MFS transporter